MNVGQPWISALAVGAVHLQQYFVAEVAAVVLLSAFVAARFGARVPMPRW